MGTLGFSLFAPLVGVNEAGIIQHCSPITSYSARTVCSQLSIVFNYYLFQPSICTTQFENHVSRQELKASKWLRAHEPCRSYSVVLLKLYDVAYRMYIFFKSARDRREKWVRGCCPGQYAPDLLYSFSIKRFIFWQIRSDLCPRNVILATQSATPSDLTLQTRMQLCYYRLTVKFGNLGSQII